MKNNYGRSLSITSSVFLSGCCISCTSSLSKFAAAYSGEAKYQNVVGENAHRYPLTYKDDGLTTHIMIISNNRDLSDRGERRDNFPALQAAYLALDRDLERKNLTVNFENIISDLVVRHGAILPWNDPTKNTRLDYFPWNDRLSIKRYKELFIYSDAPKTELLSRSIALVE